VNVTVLDLSGPGTTQILATAVDVGVVRYIERSRSNTEYRYIIEPGPIQPRADVPVRPGLTMRWWLKLKVPEQARAGIYRGAVTITPSGAAAQFVSLSILLFTSSVFVISAPKGC